MLRAMLAALAFVLALGGCASRDGVWVGWMHIDPPTDRYGAWTPFGTVNNLDQCKLAGIQGAKALEESLRRDGYTDIVRTDNTWTARFPDGQKFWGQMICLPSTVDPRTTSATPPSKP